MKSWRPSVSGASWSEINTYIHFVSRREQRCSCPCSLISSRNSSRLSDKLWCNRNITQNSWIQCLEVGEGTTWLIQNIKNVDKLDSQNVLNWPDEVAYPLALCWLLVVQRRFICEGFSQGADVDWSWLSIRLKSHFISYVIISSIWLKSFWLELQLYCLHGN